ncbi:MAG: hypothetical protein ACKOEM_19570 [Planctomycetia bacterium]
MTLRRLTLAGLALALSLASVARAADALPRALAAPLTAAWTGLPLRAAADRLAEIGGVAVVVDRRIDPGTLVDLDAEREKLADVLTRVATAAGAEAAAYAGHVRIVPRGHGAALVAAERQRVDELRGLAPRFRTAALANHTAEWPDGAVPRELVGAAAAEAGIVLAGLDELPHDHFPAAHLPPLPLAHRVDLLLAHFDRRVEWKPRVARGSDEIVYPIVRIVPADPAAAEADLLPRVSRTTVPAAAAPPGSVTTFTLTVAAPLEELLATVGRRLGLRIDLERAALARVGVAPGEIVRLEVRDASREQLLDAILEPRGLAWRIEGDTLRVSAAER